MVKFKAEIAELVKEVGSISLDVFKNDFIEFVKEHFKNIDQSNENKIDRSLLRNLCNIVESTYNKKNIVDEKLDKKKLVVDVYTMLKPLSNNDNDRKILENLIEDLHNVGEIKKVSFKRKTKKRLSGLLKKVSSIF